jgi:hypothetical protein
MFKIIILLCFFYLFFNSISFAQYQCNWNVFSNAGGSLSSTNYLSSASVSQTAIGSLTSSNFLAYLGFWYPSIGTGITEDKKSEITNLNPLVTKLYSAKPNPFNSQTAIRYSLSTRSKVILEIYDISGRIVKTLVNADKTPGIYSINWNCKNNRNQSVASGIYFYKLQASDYESTKKLLLIE